MKKIPLLDLGNVVVKVDFRPFLTWLTERSKEQNFEKVSRLLTSSLFYDFEFGQLSREGFTRRVGQLFEAEFSPRELEEKFCDIFPGLVEGMEPLVDEWLAEGPVYCLSNTNEMHLSHLRAKYPLMNRFTKIFASHEMHQRKPYPGIYRDVARELNVPPASLVFFDDVHGNVQGALRAGLDAYLFTEAGEARERLKGDANLDDKATRG